MKNTSTALVVLAALFWGVSGGIGGILTSRGWDPLVASFYRGAIGLLFVLVWLALQPQGSGLKNRKLWLWSVVAGLGIAGNFSFYFISIAEGSVAVAATLMYCAPIFVFIISFILKLEKPSLLKWATVVMVILGVGLLTEIYKIGAGEVSILAILAGLGAGLSYATFLFGLKFAAPHGSPQAILTIAFATMTLVLVWMSDTGQTLKVLSAPNWHLFVILGVLGAGLSFIIYVIGLNHTPPAVASIVAMVEPVTASLVGFFILFERLYEMQLLGMGLILAAVTALSIFSDSNDSQY